MIRAVLPPEIDDVYAALPLQIYGIICISGREGKSSPLKITLKGNILSNPLKHNLFNKLVRKNELMKSLKFRGFKERKRNSKKRKVKNPKNTKKPRIKYKRSSN